MESFFLSSTTAFCDSVIERIWDKYGVVLTVEVLLIVVFLFVTISLLIYLTSRVARLNREDSIACVLLFGKKDFGDGCTSGDADFWRELRPQFDLVADHVLSPVPAFRERNVGKPVGKQRTSARSKR